MFFKELRAGRVRSLAVGSRRFVPASALQDWVNDGLEEQFPDIRRDERRSTEKLTTFLEH